MIRTPRWLHPSSEPEATNTDRGLLRLVSLLRDQGREAMVKGLATEAGLPQQAVSVAFATWMQVQLVEWRLDPTNGRRCWRWTGRSPALATPVPYEARRFSVAEAAEVTGLTQKALRRRIERGTLAAFKDEDGRLGISFDALRKSGLLGPGTGGTHQENRSRQLIRALAGGRIFTTWELQRESGDQPRQTCEIALAALLAVGLVRKGFDSIGRQYTWQWSGPPV